MSIRFTSFGVSVDGDVKIAAGVVDDEVTTFVLVMVADEVLGLEDSVTVVVTGVIDP